MRVFIQSIVAQLLLNPYIFWRGRQALPPKRRWQIPFAAAFIAEVSLYLFGFLFRKELPDDVMIAIQAICNTWYIASIYITLSLLLLEGLRLGERLFHWYPAFVRTHWRETKLFLFVAIPLGVSLLMVEAYRTVAQPVVKHVSITLPRAASGGRDSLRIVMMSDLHIGEVVGKEWVQHYVALSNGERPDLVVLVGDIIDYESRFAEKARIEEDLRKLEAPLGVYAVYGNHEYRANRHAKQRWLRKTGAVLLVDSVVMPDSSFYLIGRDDYINKRRAPLQQLTEGLDRSKPLIVLEHQPWSFAEMAMNDVGLALYGHTHNGQLWPYPLLMKLVYECPYGYHRRGPTQFYVSSGIGIAGPPYRVGTLSELVVLHIRFQ